MMNNHWQNGQANGMFMPGAAHLNPSMYGNMTGTPGFDVNGFTMPNAGTPQSQTPQLQGQPFGQPFNPASVVPAKRPHDGMSGSPQQQQPPQQLPSGSRAQTPSYNNFAGSQQGQQFGNVPTPYQHLQQPGSNNATPSPTMQSQPFRPPQQQGQSQNQQQQQQQQQQQSQSRMNTTSPSPFPPQAQPNFGNQMSPMPQTPTQQNNMQLPQQPPQQQSQQSQQQQQMNQFAPQYGMAGAGMGMPGMMPMQQMRMNNMGAMTPDQQRSFQMQMMAKQQQQQQQQMRANMMPGRQAGMQPGQMNNFGSQQPGMQMVNGQAGTSAQMLQMQQQQQQQQQQQSQQPYQQQGPSQQQQQQQMKRAQFLRNLQSQAQLQGRQFNPAPLVSGKPVDLYFLWSAVAASGGSMQVERNGQWVMVAMKLGFNQAQIPTAAEEIKQIFGRELTMYEQLWLKTRKQDPSRQTSQQMPGMAGPPQQSPVKSAQTPGPPNQFNQFPQPQPGQPHPQATPVQAHATLDSNGMTTPQQMMPGQGLQHRRNSSLRKPEPMTPQANGATSAAAASPLVNKQRAPSIKREPAGPLMKSEEPQSSNYEPLTRTVETDGGYDIAAVDALGSIIMRAMPTDPAVEDMGVVDIRAITLSLASGIHSEVRCALDALAVLSNDQRIALNLEYCEELLDAVVDCAEEQLDILSEEAAEVSDGLDLASYEDVLRGGRTESTSLQELAPLGTHEYDLDRAADKIIAITTVFRNLSFYEVNHRLLTSPPLIKWLSNAIRLLGTRNMLLRNYINTQDFYKDSIIFLSNVTQSLELPTKDDALHILQFLLTFTPQPVPTYSTCEGKICFTSFDPAVHRYLPPAVDCLAKLLARQEPNRGMYQQIFNATSGSLSGLQPLDLLTQAFALAISVLPDRTRAPAGDQVQYRIVEARKAYLTQGMLAADILSALAPSNDAALARTWIESEDGWTVGLLKLSALLSVDQNQVPHPKSRDYGPLDFESFKLITNRGLTMLKRLTDRVGKEPTALTQLASPAKPASLAAGQALTNGSATSSAAAVQSDGTTADQTAQRPGWEGIPFEHAILGAMSLGQTDKVALGLLHDLHDMAVQV